MKLSSAVANNIEQFYEDQSRFSDFNEYKKKFTNLTTYRLMTEEKLSRRFKSDHFFISLNSRSKENYNTLLLSPFYSFVFEKCLRNCFEILNEVNFDMIVSTSFDIKEPFSFFQDDIFIDEETKSRKIIMFSSYIFQYDDYSHVLDKKDRINKALSEILVREFEEIASKIHDLVLSHKFIPKSYFIRKTGNDTNVLFMDMDMALESIDVDDFSSSISQFQFNDYDIEDFVNKATIIEINKRKNAIIQKTKEIYNESGSSLNNLLKYL